MSPDDRREFHRAGFHVAIAYKRIGALLETWQNGTMTDVSAGGLRFTTDDPIDQGAQLEFKLVLPIRKDAYILDGLVVSEQPADGGSVEYGVAFLDLEPDRQAEVDELVRFLNRSREDA